MKKILLITLVVILSACSLGTSSEFTKNRQLWQDAGITHYRFSLSILCFCIFSEQMPITIEVQNNEVVSMTYPDGTLVTPDDPNYTTFANHAVIDNLFSELEAGLQDADEVTVTYDAAYGFPNSIHFDYVREIADDELGLSVSGFEVLQ